MLCSPNFNHLGFWDEVLLQWGDGEAPVVAAPQLEAKKPKVDPVSQAAAVAAAAGKSAREGRPANDLAVRSRRS